MHAYTSVHMHQMNFVPLIQPLVQPYISKKNRRDHDRSSKCIINAYKPHRISTNMNRAERGTSIEDVGLSYP